MTCSGILTIGTPHTQKGDKHHTVFTRHDGANVMRYITNVVAIGFPWWVNDQGLTTLYKQQHTKNMPQASFNDVPPKKFF